MRGRRKFRTPRLDHQSTFEMILSLVRQHRPNELAEFKRTIIAESDRIGILLETVSGLASTTVLEFGPGLGVFACALQKGMGMSVQAYELENLIERDSGFLKDLGIPVVGGPVKWKGLPFPDSSFDLVVMSQVIAHVRASHLEVLEDVRRVLRPDGSLILTTVNIGSLLRIRKLWSGKGLTEPMPDRVLDGHHPTEHWMHIKEYGAEELSDLLARAGFIVQEEFTFEENSVHYPTTWRRFFYHLLYRVRPEFAADIGVLASRRP